MRLMRILCSYRMNQLQPMQNISIAVVCDIRLTKCIGIAITVSHIRQSNGVTIVIV